MPMESLQFSRSARAMNFPFEVNERPLSVNLGFLMKLTFLSVKLQIVNQRLNSETVTTCLESDTHLANPKPTIPSSILQLHSESSILFTNTKFLFGTEISTKWPSGDHVMSLTWSINENCYRICRDAVSKICTSMPLPIATRSPLWL